MLEVQATLPRDLIEHWNRARPLRWFSYNPLVVYRMRSRPGSYYENHFFVLLNFDYTATMLLMMDTIKEAREDRIGSMLSTSRMNNFETLDFRHYLALYPEGSRRRVLGGDCVPLGRRKPQSVETTDIPAQLSPTLWKRRRALLPRVSKLIREMEARYRRRALSLGGGGVKTRLARKVHDSFHYFRRSFRVDGYPGEMAVALATAFEVLLTDNYSRGVGSTIMDHLRLILRRVPGTRAMQAAVEHLYTARRRGCPQWPHDDRGQFPHGPARVRACCVGTQ